MIKLKNNMFYIKNIRKPGHLRIKLEAGICNHDLCKAGTSTWFDLSPVDYLPGGVHNTGRIFEDLKNYTCRMLEEVRSELYFDLLKGKVDTAKKIVSFYKSSDEEDNKILYTIVKDVSSIYNNYDVLTKLSQWGIFNIRIVGIDTDIEFLPNYEPISEFILLFHRGMTSKSTVERTTDNKQFKLSSNAYSVIYTIREFIDILTKVFFYYASQIARDEYTAISALIHCLKYNKFDGICLWNHNLKRFENYNGITAFNALAFDVSYICTNINNQYWISRDDTGAYPETVNPLDMARMREDKEDVIITSIIRDSKAQGDNSIKIDSHIAYIPYLNKEGVPECVAIEVYSRSKSYKSKFINMAMRNHGGFVSSRHCSLSNKGDASIEKEFWEVDYKYLPDNCLSSKVKQCDDLTFECRVAYFTRAGGMTISDYNSLEKKRIPKQRRDLIYKGLCSIAQEAEIDLKDLVDELNVDFTRYYKLPIKI